MPGLLKMLITIMVRLVMQVQSLSFNIISSFAINPSSLLPGGQLARFHGDDSAVPAGAGVDGQDGPEQPQQKALLASAAGWLTPSQTRRGGRTC